MKNAGKKKSKIQKDLFVLKPLKQNMYFKTTTKVEFPTRINKYDLIIEQASKKLIKLIRCSNQMGNPIFLPSSQKWIKYFSLRDNQSEVVRNLSQIAQLKDKRLLQRKKRNSKYLQAKRYFFSLFFLFQFVPKPGKKSKYCGVCKLHFEDYLKHISLGSHKKCIKNAKIEIDIREMIQSLIFEKKHFQINEESSNTREDTDPGPSKKLKIQQLGNGCVFDVSNSDKMLKIQEQNHLFQSIQKCSNINNMNSLY